MKKIICGMLFLLATGMGFTSCSDDDEDITISHSTTPEIASAGTYSGTWTKEKVGGETTTASGTLVLAATDAEGKHECPHINHGDRNPRNLWSCGICECQ